MIARGKSALRELRSQGRKNVWLCQMGRAAIDGDFASFQRKVLVLPVNFGDLSVQLTTLRGEQLAFGWKGPLLLASREVPISNFKHFDHPYCTADWPAPKLEIRHAGETLTLDSASLPAARD